MAPRFADLKAEYADLWQRMTVSPNRVAAVTQIANRLLGFKSRYQNAAQATGVPWFVIAALHNRESDADFTTYLGNGEPLHRVTRLVPAGRGPFPNWEAGAIDALHVDGLNQVTDWSPERACYEVEKFNGFGYRNRGLPSPYLWSFSNNYHSGKFVADRRFDPNFVDQQCGAIPIIKEIMARDPSAVFPSGPSVPTGPPAPLAVGSRGDRVTELQNLLTRCGFNVGQIDGIYGTVTRDAVIAFQQSAHLSATGIADDTTMRALAAKAAPGPIVDGVPHPPLHPDHVLRILLEELGKLAAARTGAPGAGTPAGLSVLQQILLAAFRPAALAADASAAAGGAAPTAGAPVLSPIDRMLGGEALAGKKTALAIVGYAIMAILQIAEFFPPTSPTAAVVKTIITAFGGLGALSKIDRVIQILGMIAAKRPG
jgi:lysozyme family protein/peptidoglycan hydrolase-like protein with peptidoglycan-binding domain